MDEKHRLWHKHAKEIASIVSVASAETRDEYVQRAQKAAQDLTPEQLTNLPKFFHDNRPDIPQDQAERFEGFSGSIDWMAAVQRAIFAIYRFCPDVSLPIVRDIAFGVYDWTQITALETLCVFARAGIEREQIVEEITDAIPRFRREALMPAISYVSSVGYAHPKLIQLLEKYIHEETQGGDPVDAMRFITGLAKVDRESGKKYELLLHDLMNGKGLEDRPPILDGAVVNDSGEAVSWGRSGPPPAQIHQINAALLLWYLFPEDKEALDNLKDWQMNHPDEQIRKSLQYRLKDEN